MKGDQKLGWTGITLTEFDDVDWFTSPERKEAVEKFLQGETLQPYPIRDPDNMNNKFGEIFRNSREFANARHAYRRRVNGTD